MSSQSRRKATDKKFDRTRDSHGSREHHHYGREDKYKNEDRHRSVSEQQPRNQYEIGYSNSGRPRIQHEEYPYSEYPRTQQEDYAYSSYPRNQQEENPYLGYPQIQPEENSYLDDQLDQHGEYFYSETPQKQHEEYSYSMSTASTPAVESSLRSSNTTTSSADSMESPYPSWTRLATASAARPISKTQSTSWDNDDASNHYTISPSSTADPRVPDIASSSQYSSSIATPSGVSRLLQAMNPFKLVAKYAGTGRYVPKAVAILIRKTEHLARPDTGSDRNIISRAYAKQHGISVTGRKAETFRLGTGKLAQSTGVAACRISVPGLDFKKTVDFFVMKECPHSLIIGSKLIEELQLYTRNKHLLVSHLSFKRGFPILNRIGTRRQYIPFTADGFSLRATPDTGSDLDFISEDCAIRYGFEINSSDDLQRLILLGDNSTTETIGEAQIESVVLQNHDSFTHTFHVLRGLPCDVIFGEEFLEAIDAFNTCEIVLGNEDSSDPQFNGLGDMGPSSWQSRYGKLRYGSGPADTSQESDLVQHDRAINAEIYQRNKTDREVSKSETGYWRTENARRAAFVQSHERCPTCLSRPQDQRPSAWR